MGERERQRGKEGGREGEVEMEKRHGNTEKHTKTKGETES